MQPPMRKITLAVSLFAVTAWAQDAQVKAEAEPERHAVWLHTAFSNQLTGVSLGYEHWFSRSVSVQMALGGSYNRSLPVALGDSSGLGGVGGLGGVDTWAVGTEVQLRWYFALGIFVAESVALQWQRMLTVVGIGSQLGALGTDSTHCFEAVLAGWGHTFAGGLRLELYAGPSVALSFAGPSLSNMSTNSINLNARAGIGVGYAF